MNVNDWITGKEIWSYYLNTAENLNGMNRIYTGSKGDYGMMGIYAEGYIDNVRLTAPVAITPTPTAATKAPSVTTIPTKTLTPKLTTVAPTSYPTDTPSSPSAGILAITALGIIGVCGVLAGRKRTNPYLFKKDYLCFKCMIQRDEESLCLWSEILFRTFLFCL